MRIDISFSRRQSLPERDDFSVTNPDITVAYLGCANHLAPMNH